MTRLLLVGCFKCTQFNLSFCFTFLLQSRSSLRFGHQLLHNLQSMENRVKLIFSLHFGHILAPHLISHDHFAFLLSIHLLLQSVLACYAKDFCYFRFSLFARLKEKHFYRFGVKIEKWLWFHHRDRPLLSLTDSAERKLTRRHFVLQQSTNDLNLKPETYASANM